LTNHADRTRDIPTRDRGKINAHYKQRSKDKCTDRTIAALNQDRAEMKGMSPVNRNLKRACLKLELEMMKKVLRSQNINVKQLVESNIVKASAKVNHLSAGSELRLDADGITKHNTFAYQKEYEYIRILHKKLPTIDYGRQVLAS